MAPSLSPVGPISWPHQLAPTVLPRRCLQSVSLTVMGNRASGGWDDSQWTGPHDSCKQDCQGGSYKQDCQGDSCKRAGGVEGHSWYYKQVSLEQTGGLQAGQERDRQDRQDWDRTQRRKTDSVGQQGRTSLELTDFSTSSFGASEKCLISLS